MAEPDNSGSHVRTQFILSLVLLLALLLVNFLFWQFTKNNIDRLASEIFFDDTTQLLQLFQKRSARIRMLVDSGAALFSSEKTINRGSFANFYQYILDKNPKELVSVSTIAYIENVTDLNLFDTRLKTDPILNPQGIGYFSVFPSTSKTGLHHIFNFVVPETTNKQLIGYDISSDPAQMKYLELALKNDQGVFSTPHQILLNAERFVIYRKVDSQSGQEGLIVIALKPDQLFDNLFESDSNNYLSFKVYDKKLDLKNNQEESYFYSNFIGKSEKINTDDKMLTRQATFDFFGQEFTLVAQSPEKLQINSYISQLPNILFFFGVAFDFFAFYFVSYILLSRHPAANKKVAPSTLYQAPPSPED
jgi:CHASE1-domain containing sensor protein